MSELADGFARALSSGQLDLIARSCGLYSGRSLVDVGTGDGAWVRKLAAQGRAIRGMEERKHASAAADAIIAIGSPAAAVPYAAHSVDAILFRGTSVFQADAFQPELLIALANLGSSLKPRGALLIPLGQDPAVDAARWESQLGIFPGSCRVRNLSTGVLSYLTLSFLWRGVHAVSLLEFRVNRRVESRLEWHRLAREAVLRRLQSPAAA